MNAYERIADLVRWLDDHPDLPVDLAALAGRAGVSPGHLQHEFVRWTGVTPHSFRQCLTARHARTILEAGVNVMDAALATGLSGPGRLHDLMVKLEAASPGEIQRGGAGMTLRFGFGPSPFGRCLIADSPRGVCHLAFVDQDDSGALDELKERWTRATLLSDPEHGLALLDRIFRPASSRTGPPIRAYVQGSRFQLQVWRALLQIPEGRLISYESLARQVQKPGAARAVGNAVGANTLAWLIPCHRVIRNTGVIGHYRWGKDRKRIMIAMETATPDLAGHGRPLDQRPNSARRT